MLGDIFYHPLVREVAVGKLVGFPLHVPIMCPEVVNVIGERASAVVSTGNVVEEFLLGVSSNHLVVMA